jgi:hypothetical protein
MLWVLDLLVIAGWVRRRCPRLHGTRRRCAAHSFQCHGFGAIVTHYVAGHRSHRHRVFARRRAGGIFRRAVGARGAYAFLRVGSGAEHIAWLGEPAHGRVLFAGEATSPTRFGYTDGAFSSGVREAKRLLQRSRVRLRLPR